MLVLLSSLATAQDPDPTPLPEAGEVAPVEAPRVHHIDFGKEVRVEGTLYGPTGKFVSTWTPPPHNPLIVLRTDWNAEMSASVQQIR